MLVYDIQEPLACLHEGRAGEAIPMLEQLLQITPGHVTTYVLLARAYAAEARWQQAMIAWQQAAFLMPNSPAIQDGLAQALSMFSLVGIEEDVTVPTEEDAEASVAELDTEASLPGETSEEAPPLVVDAAIETDVPAIEQGEPDVEAAPASDAPVDPTASWDDDAASLPDFLPEALSNPGDIDPPPHFLEADPAPDVIEEPVFFENPTPPPPAPPEEDVELDKLIADLESARIVPRPDYETIEAPDLSAPIDDMVSETLARIYEGQKQYAEAARMYDKLAILKPDRAGDFARKAVELRTRAHSE